MTQHEQRLLAELRAILAKAKPKAPKRLKAIRRNHLRLVVDNDKGPK